MAKSDKSQQTSSRNQPARLKQRPPVPRPGGKLGSMIDLLARQDGASAAELVAETGWQRPSVLGALSRLRTRGFLMRMAGPDAHGERTYHLDVRVELDEAS